MPDSLPSGKLAMAFVDRWIQPWVIPLLLGAITGGMTFYIDQQVTNNGNSEKLQQQDAHFEAVEKRMDRAEMMVANNKDAVTKLQYDTMQSLRTFGDSLVSRMDINEKDRQNRSDLLVEKMGDLTAKVGMLTERTTAQQIQMGQLVDVLNRLYGAGGGQNPTLPGLRR